MSLFRYSRRLPAVVAAASLAAAPVAPSTFVATASAKASPQHKLTNKQRAKLRRQLRAELEKHPANLFKKSFLRKADLVDFKLPLTVRLDTSNGQGGFLPSDDQLEVDYDDSTTVWPLTGGTLPASQLTYLSGTFTMQASFGSDATGYGELGAMETVQGNAITMKADPFTISDFDPACGSGPQLAADPANKILVSSAGPRFGVMNMFSQQFRGSLSLRMTFASQTQDTCGGTVAPTPTVDNSNAPPMPMRLDGKFYVSPAITSDGKMRFGKIVVDDSATPQTSTFAYVRSCTGTLTCDPQQFPARLKVKKLTADVLLGDIRSSSP
jgi:hypothetical protein